MVGLLPTWGAMASEWHGGPGRRHPWTHNEKLLRSDWTLADHLRDTDRAE